MRLRPIATLLTVLFVLAGCAPTTGTGGPTATASPPGATSAAPAPTTVPPPPASEPADDGIEYRVSYAFAVPSPAVTIAHPITPPIAAPPAPPLPYLVGVYVGNHPEGSPQYQRISFEVTGIMGPFW